MCPGCAKAARQSRLIAAPGLLSARLAGRAAVVCGIELDEYSHAAAEKLKELNRLNNFYPVCGDVGDKLADTIKKCKAVSDETFVVMDPPRAGISDRARGRSDKFRRRQHSIYKLQSRDSGKRREKTVGRGLPSLLL